MHTWADNIKAKNRWDCIDGSAKEVDLDKAYKDIDTYTQPAVGANPEAVVDSFVPDEFQNCLIIEKGCKVEKDAERAKYTVQFKRKLKTVDTARDIQFEIGDKMPLRYSISIKAYEKDVNNDFNLKSGYPIKDKGGYA